MNYEVGKFYMRRDKAKILYLGKNTLVDHNYCHVFVSRTEAYFYNYYGLTAAHHEGAYIDIEWIDLPVVGSVWAKNTDNSTIDIIVVDAKVNQIVCRYPNGNYIVCNLEYFVKEYKYLRGEK